MKKVTKKPLKKASKVVKLTAIEQKRVDILKDAILQAKAGAYEVKASNGYVVSDELDNEIHALYDVAEIISDKGSKEELKTYMDRLVNKDKPCQVCAKGSLLISAIRKYNNVSLKEANFTDLGDMASSKTCQIFGVNNANKMETYFEHSFDSTDDEMYDTPEDHKINAFYLKHKDDTDRLIAIFQNAIANKGTFKP